MAHREAGEPSAMPAEVNSKFLQAWLSPSRKSSWVTQWITGSGNTAVGESWRKCSGKLSFGPSRGCLLLFHSLGRDFWQLGSKSFPLPSK